MRLEKLKKIMFFKMRMVTYHLNPKWQRKKNGIREVFEEIKAENF